MNSESQPIRAPQDARYWTPTDGFLFDNVIDPPAALARGEVVLVVSDDGYLRGVLEHDRAPLAAVVRIDADVAELVARVGEVAEHAAAGVREARARTDALVRRVDALGDRCLDSTRASRLRSPRSRHCARRLEERTLR